MKDNSKSLKSIRERENKAKEAEIKILCEEYAIKKVGDFEKLKELSNKHKGLWYLPSLTDDEQIDKMLIMKPITREVLSYASTKISDDGMYAFLEAAMRECAIEEYSDMAMITEEDYFLGASFAFNKMIEGKKSYLLKR